MTDYIKNPFKSKALTSTGSNSHGIIALNTCENSMSKIQTKPNFHSNNVDIRTDFNQSVYEVAASLMRLSEQSYNKMFESARGAELLEKADEYNIPYTSGSINWLDLIDEIASYETLLEEANDYNIDWDTSEYDPVGLEQEIEYCVRQEIAAKKDLYSDFFATRGLEA